MTSTTITFKHELRDFEQFTDTAEVTVSAKCIPALSPGHCEIESLRITQNDNDITKQVRSFDMQNICSAVGDKYHEEHYAPFINPFDNWLNQQFKHAVA